MAQPPPRPTAHHAGGIPSSGAPSPSPASTSGTRTKDPDKQQEPGTFFLGRYRVVDEIGVGGMASVHLARMDGPGGFQKWVAIKRIHPHLVEDDQFVDMFLDEARIAAGINHANVAQVFDLGKDDNTYWIAMEYLHGEPLREVMRRAEDRKLLVSPDLAARICADAAEGLHAAHELRKNGQLLGLVHRDVTPHNLFLTYDGYTKVVDFGIAKVADRLSSTRAGTLKGKLAYMSPEQVRGAEVDRTTDIFALGVVLWEITTNHRLFRMDTDLDTLEKVQACVVPPPSRIVQGYPPELESVVMKALAKKKQDRFQTARDFSRALQGYLLRRGAFVGPEEVAQFVRHVFADRIQKREAHLAWAAEVTGTVNVDKLGAGQSGADAGADAPALAADAANRQRPSAQQPAHAPHMSGAASGARPATEPAPAPFLPQAPPPMDPNSLMDDDEDVPTTVATRDHIEGMSGLEHSGFGPIPGSAQAPGGSMDRLSSPRPAAGMPAAAGQGFGHAPGGFPPVANEHTAALPSGLYPPPPAGALEDLGSTVALPSALQQQESRAALYARQGASALGGPRSPQAAAGGDGRPADFGYPQQQYPQQPGGYGQNAFGQQPPFPGGPPGMSPLYAQGGMSKQSQIETAVSLPRPDPAAVWLAQQEVAQRSRPRNTGVLIAVVALTALCVIGVGALLYYKLTLREGSTPPAIGTETGGSAAVTAAAPAATAPATAPPTAAATATASPSAAATATPTSAAPPANAAAAAPTTGQPSNAAAAPSTGGAAPAGTSGQGTNASSAGKEQPGFLTVVCNPYCDDVLDQGRSLGPSPVVHVAVKPGQHRITLKRGSETKVISVIIVAGQVTAQRVSMK